MEPRDDSMRDRLLSHLPQPANLAAYREEVATLLAKNEKGLRRERRMVIELWIFVIAVSILFLWLGGQHLDTFKGPYFVGLACFWFLFGTVYFVAYSINRSRVDILKEVKQVQVQVLELQTLVSKSEGQKASNS